MSHEQYLQLCTLVGENKDYKVWKTPSDIFFYELIDTRNLPDYDCVLADKEAEKLYPMLCVEAMLEPVNKEKKMHVFPEDDWSQHFQCFPDRFVCYYTQIIDNRNRDIGYVRESQKDLFKHVENMEEYFSNETIPSQRLNSVLDILHKYENVISYSDYAKLQRLVHQLKEFL